MKYELYYNFGMYNVVSNNGNAQVVVYSSQDMDSCLRYIATLLPYAENPFGLRLA